MNTTRLPEGTATFLFTDIEGSTRLVHELGDDYGKLLGYHHAVLREVVARHDGIEIGTEGDAFFVVFSSVPDALNAAAEIQQKFANGWMEGNVELPVRMGVHTGEAQLAGDNYVGLDIHRAARISAAAHGGQILMSAATAEHARGSPSLARELQVLELGRFQLKDLPEPERLHQLTVEGLRSAFPPPRALGGTIRLPTHLGDFVARDQEASDISELLSIRRLVTLTGPGGIGKTRLATEVAKASAVNFPDGVVFVPLAQIFDPELVPSTVAQALSLREEGSRPIVQTLVDYLELKRILLVLDNFEQVVTAAPVVSELLTGAPKLTVLATSRAALRLTGEHVYPVPPMNLPDLQLLPGVSTLRTYESVDLFMRRATAVKADFALTEKNAAAISEICVRLDGLPLAIELAAARTRLLSPEEVLRRLDGNLSILSEASRDVPERQRTLMQTIDWSVRLLDEAHCRMFRRLAIFQGGCSLEAAEAICDPNGELGVDSIDALETLVENSLVRVLRPDEKHTRFAMLMTVREYAAKALAESGERELLCDRHAAYFSDLVGKAEAEMFLDDLDWPDRLEHEHDNLRACLRLFIDERRVLEGLELAAGMWRFWQVRSHLAEGRRWLSELLALAESREFPAARGAALTALGGLSYWQNDYDVARGAYEEALELFTSLEDRRGVAQSVYNLGFLALIEGDSQRALTQHRRSLDIYAELGDEEHILFAKWGLAMSEVQEGNFEAARSLGLEALEGFGRISNWFGKSLAEFVIIQVDRLTGNHDAALALLVESLGQPGSLADVSSVSSSLELYADISIAIGRVRRGITVAGAAFDLRTEYGGGAPPPLLLLEDPRKLVAGRLSPAEIDELWERGREMSIHETVAYMLKDPEGDE